jgi:puromycin-sensitive aminopeptidase
LADSGERDPSVWSVVLGAVGLFERVVPDTDRPALAASVRSLLGPLSRELGWDPRDDDGERTPALRAAVLRTLGTVGDDKVVQQEAFRRFRSGSGLDPDIESAVLDIVAATGGEDEFEAFLARYRAPANPQEENRYLYALAAFNDPGLATRAFELATSEVRTQNAPFLVQLLLANRVTGPGIWERVTEEWDALVAAFPSNMLPRMLDGVRLLCNPPSLAERVTRFIEAHPLPAGGKTVEQILERLAVNVTFGQREAADLAGTLGHGLGLPGS